MTGGQAPSDTTPGAQADLRALADAFSGTLAVAARDRRTGELVRVDGDRSMPTASVIKLSVLVAVFARAHAGELSLEDRVALRAADRVGGSGVIKELSEGTALTIRDLATLMVVVSDNMATNLLVDAAGGVEAVNAYVNERLGLTAITLHRKLFHVGGTGPLAVATPDDLLALIDGLLAGRVVSEGASAEMLSILGRQQYLDQAPRLVDRDALADPDSDDDDDDDRIAVACKTGMIAGVRADAGVLWLAGEPVSYAIMAEAAGGDDGLDLDADVQLVAAEAGAVLVRRFWPADDGGEPPLARHPAARWSELDRAAGQPAR